MKFIGFEKVKDGKYLKNYELTYINKAGREKKYEIVSRKELNEISDLGRQPSGVSIIVTMNDRFLLLHEFRMGVNKKIYNLCAGMIEDDETIEECIARELFEETGLKLKEIHVILPPSYAAVAITDTKTYIAFVEAEDDSPDHASAFQNDHSSENEEIEAGFYTKAEIKELLKTEEFSSRAQLAAFCFAYDIYSHKDLSENNINNL